MYERLASGRIDQVLGAVLGEFFPHPASRQCPADGTRHMWGPLVMVLEVHRVLNRLSQRARVNREAGR